MERTPITADQLLIDAEITEQPSDKLNHTTAIDVRYDPDVEDIAVSIGHPELYKIPEMPNSTDDVVAELGSTAVKAGDSTDNFRLAA